MIRPTCSAPVGLARLVEYWLAELDAATEARIEEHLFGCGVCSRELEELAALATGMRQLVRQGAVHMVLSNAFVRRLAEQGLRVREYNVPHNGSVDCTVAPEDDMVVARLQAPLQGIERLDLVEGEARERLYNIPFNAKHGEVVVIPRVEELRKLPASTLRMRLVAVDASGERVIGEYTFHHTPYSGRSSAT
jgi:hypothetical protein